MTIVFSQDDIIELDHFELADSKATGFKAFNDFSSKKKPGGKSFSAPPLDGDMISG